MGHRTLSASSYGPIVFRTDGESSFAPFSPTELFVRPGRTYQAERLWASVSPILPACCTVRADPSLPGPFSFTLLTAPTCTGPTTRPVRIFHPRVFSVLPYRRQNGQITSNNVSTSYTSMESTLRTATVWQTARGRSVWIARKSSGSWAGEMDRVGYSHGERSTAERCAPPCYFGDHMCLILLTHSHSWHTLCTYLLSA